MSTVKDDPKMIENRIRELEEKIKNSESTIEEKRKEVYKIKNSQHYKHYEESLKKGNQPE